MARTQQETRVERAPAGNGSALPFQVRVNGELLRTKGGIARRFKTEAAAQKALDEAAPVRVRIHLQDHGQDFLWWDLEERDRLSYRVVDCGPFQAWMWTQYFVRKDSVRKGHQPLISKDRVDCSPLLYPITRIERLARALHTSMARVA